MSQNLLTILIPTRNRLDHVSTLLEKFSDILKESQYSSEIEIIVADNFSKGDLKKVVLDASKVCKNIKYKKHLKERLTAESSMAYAVNFCSGKYVWCFGDDDIPSNDCFDKIIPILKQELAHFLLLNMELKLKDNEVVNYIKATSSITLYDSGEKLFQDFGLISATTTLSCLLFKKDDFSVKIFDTYASKSEVYSHSFSLLNMFYDKSCAFVSDPVLIYSQNSSEEEVYRFSKVYGDKFSSYPFTVGLVDLICVLSKATNIKIDKILSFNEVEISKASWAVCSQSLGNFFISHCLNQLTIWARNPNIFDKEASIKLIKSILFLKESSKNIPDGFKEFVETLFKKLSLKNEAEKSNHKEMLESISLWSTFLVKSNLQHNTSSVVNAKYNNSPVSLYFDAGGPLKLLSGESGDHIYQNDLGKDKKINLTILIPSFDRAKELDKTLNNLSSWGRSFNNQIEIIIALNACSDNSQEIADSYSKRFDFIRVHYHNEFVHSAEENISRSIELCKGEYIWTLGDDDFVSLEAFILLNYLVRNAKKSPAILFNHAISNNKNLSLSRHSNSLDVDVKNNISLINYQKLVEKHGLTTSMAFISRYIIHRDYISSFGDYIKVSPIYSHSFFFLKKLYDKDILWVNYPLIVRYDSYVQKRINNLSDGLNVNKFHLWSGGILKLYLKLCDETDINKNFLFKINEFQGNTYYRLSSEILQNIIRQYKIYLKVPKYHKPVFHDILLYKILSFDAPDLEKKKILHIINELIKIDDLVNQFPIIDYETSKKCKELLDKLTAINLDIKIHVRKRKNMFQRIRNSIRKKLKKSQNKFPLLSNNVKIRYLVKKIFPKP